MDKNLLALKIEGQDGEIIQELAPPSNIPATLQGGLGSVMDLIQLLVQILLLAGVTIAVIVLMISGIQWITSGGDPVKVASARRRLMFALLGVIVMSGAFFIVRVVITVLGGDPSKFLDPGSFLR